MEPKHHIANPGEPSQSACVLSAGKMANLIYGHHGSERSISATEQVQRKSYKFFDFVACRVRGSIFTTNRSPRGEI